MSIVEEIDSYIIELKSISPYSVPYHKLHVLASSISQFGKRNRLDYLISNIDEDIKEYGNISELDTPETQVNKFEKFKKKLLETVERQKSLLLHKIGPDSR